MKIRSLEIKLLQSNKKVTNLVKVNEQLHQDLRVGQKISKKQEQLFTEMVKHKELDSMDNLIEAKNKRGPPKKLLIVHDSRVPSNEACKSTIRARYVQHSFLS